MGRYRSLGPLRAWEPVYERWLVERGYRPGAVSDRMTQFRSLDRWIGLEGLSTEQLDRAQAERFVQWRRDAGLRSSLAVSSVWLPIVFLADVGLVTTPVDLRTGPRASGAGVVGAGEIDGLLDAYREYLATERRLATRTIEGYLSVARLFLEDRQHRAGELALDRLTAADVTAFVVAECRQRTVSGSRAMAAKLRPLLAYLHVTEMTTVPLRWAVPRVADMTDRTVPRGLEPGAVARLLAGIDRDREVGRRDWAIVLLLVRLGLRANEVASMRLDDIDWRAGELLVHGKGGREDTLPLPADVGEALADYLTRRGPVASRAVFWTVHAPSGPMTRKAISDAVARASVRAGLPPARSHRLRHTAATMMLRAGCSLEEIGQVLRHRQVQTTAIYAKVDYRALRALARPWPVAQNGGVA